VERGEALRCLGRFDEAIGDFTEAIRLRPAVALGYVWRGLARQGKGDAEGALADFSKGLELKPDDWLAYYYRGRLVRRRRPQEALADFSRCLKINPQSAGAWEERARVHGQLGDRAGAIADFTSALKIRPSAVNLNERAACFAAGGQYAEAIADLADAHRLQPDDARTCDSLARVLATCPLDELRDGEWAVELARQACERSQWKESDFIDTLAAACAECGQFEEAERHGQQVVDMADPEDREEPQRRLDLYRAGKPYRTA
jgi:serine/threonine-protein kinase